MSRVHRILPTNRLQGHPGVPLLLHRQFLIGALATPSATTGGDRFHRHVHLFLLTYGTCPQFKWGTANHAFEEGASVELICC
jgi:hypothetical protein